MPVWILGSSTYGAQLAAMLGLPYAFASHFAPAELDHALDLYRSRFQPSEQLDKPLRHAGGSMSSPRTTDEAARCCSRSLQQAFVNAAHRPPRQAAAAGGRLRARRSTRRRKAMLDHALSCVVVGSAETVRSGIEAFLRRTGADELMVTAQIYDHAARKRSFEILAEVRDGARRRRRLSVSAARRPARLSGKQVGARPFFACQSPMERRVLKPGRPSALPTS